ncbi:WD40 repeat domain-containing protein, partial [Streptomyces sp. NPDC056309]|uniref:WD40 repeat domain-containing protein n=1 Tax=unclassified Streptomyces TaxID=2593676 RepID=UPI0035D8EDB1
VRCLPLPRRSHAPHTKKPLLIEQGLPLPQRTKTVVSPDGRTLAVTRSDVVRFWNVATRRQIGGPLDLGRTPTDPTIAFSPDSRVIATADTYGTESGVRLWDLKTRRQTGKLPNDGRTSADYALAFSPDGKTLATSTRDSIRIWNLATHQIGTVPGVTGWTLTFSPDGHTIAANTQDDTVALWDVATRRRIGETAPGHTAGIMAVAFSPDGKVIATASRDNTVRLWSVATRKQVGEPLTGHLSGVNSVAFSPNGKVLVSGSMDQTVRLWDVGTRRQIGEPLQGHSGAVAGAVFDPSGRTVISWGEDKTVRLWGVEATVDPVRSLCSWARGAFTAGRWRAYVPAGPAYRPLCPKSGAK